MPPLGYPPEGEGFMPHLTLGRVRCGARRDEVSQVGEVITNKTGEPLAEVPADHFGLIRSVLKPTGAEYTTLEKFVLRGG
jgi:2'-5' RNA ligase